MGTFLLFDLIFQWVNSMPASMDLILCLLSCILLVIAYFWGGPIDTLREKNVQYMSEATGEIGKMATPELKNTLLFTLQEEKRKQVKNQADREINS